MIFDMEPILYGSLTASKALMIAFIILSKENWSREPSRLRIEKF